MAELLLEFEGTVTGPNHKAYEARACGRQREDGLWEGWLEFVPLDGSEVLRTGRETTQPAYHDLTYWAGGLTYGYLDGALLRILRPTPTLTPRRSASTRPAYTEPAAWTRAATEQVSAVPHAVLDPFAVYAEGAHILKGQLNALDEGQLRSIVKAYGLVGGEDRALDRMNKPDLVALITTAVERRVA
jgi:hypothetical protein